MGVKEFEPSRVILVNLMTDIDNDDSEGSLAFGPSAFFGLEYTLHKLLRSSQEYDSAPVVP